MKLLRLIPLAILVPLRLSATDTPVGARVATITINPREITVLHLRPDFESTIRMPEEVTSVILGSPGEFKAEHNEGEPEYVYVKPITKGAAQSNLLIVTKSGQHSGSCAQCRLRHARSGLPSARWCARHRGAQLRPKWPEIPESRFRRVVLRASDNEDTFGAVRIKLCLPQRGLGLLVTQFGGSLSAEHKRQSFAQRP